MTKDEAPARSALKLALEFIEANTYGGDDVVQLITTIREALAEQPAIKQDLTPEQPAQQQEPVAWISVKDALPKAVRGVSYNASLTDVVLVRHSDRPDYPLTAHAVVGEGLGAGIAIPTEGASEHPEIAWYSASSNLNNPFDLKNDDYGRYLPKVFGSKITHWKPIDTSPPAQPQQEQKQEPVYFCNYGYESWGKVDADMAAANLADGMTVEAYYTSPPAQRKPWVGLTDEEIEKHWKKQVGTVRPNYSFTRAIEAKLKEKNSD